IRGGQSLRRLAAIDVLLACASECQQGNDIAAGQGRIRTVGDAEPFHWAMKTDCNVISTDARRHLHVNDRLDHLRIAESYVAAVKPVAGAAEGDVAFRDVHAPQHRRVGHRAANVEISITGKLGQRGLYTQLRRGENVNVKAQVIEKRIERGCGWRLGAGQILRKVEIR